MDCCGGELFSEEAVGFELLGAEELVGGGLLRKAPARLGVLPDFEGHRGGERGLGEHEGDGLVTAAKAPRWRRRSQCPHLSPR